MLSGSWPGQLYLFPRLVEGGFGKPAILLDMDGKEIAVGRASAPCVTDWDGDGDDDLIVGEIMGSVSLVENTGTDRKPVFNPPIPMEAGGNDLKVDGDSGPLAVDWDRDGDLDLLVGTSWGAVELYRNTPENGAPALGEVEILIEKKTWSSFEDGEEPSRPDSPLYPEQMGTRAKLAVCDWNADGSLDLLLGDFHSQKGPEPELSEEQLALKTRLEAELDGYSERWNQLWKEIRDQALAAIGPQKAGESDTEYNNRLWEKESELQAAHEEYSEIDQRQDEIYTELEPMTADYTSHGSVWVFLRHT